MSTPTARTILDFALLQSVAECYLDKAILANPDSVQECADDPEKQGKSADAPVLASAMHLTQTQAEMKRAMNVRPLPSSKNAGKNIHHFASHDGIPLSPGLQPQPKGARKNSFFIASVQAPKIPKFLSLFCHIDVSCLSS
ncbi:MAG: hypothetical protein LBU11_08090 [Zoogloeaceae bacterium]|jgi:hypothetical protein|nr:hypothetical protein [Zoogloeaceae bacterium]